MRTAIKQSQIDITSSLLMHRMHRFNYIKIQILCRMSGLDIIGSFSSKIVYDT